MKKIIATILTTALSLSIIMLSLPAPMNVSAADGGNLSNAFSKVQQIAGSDGAGYNTRETSLMESIGSIMKILLGLLGVVFLVLTFYAGWIWMTAQGDNKKIDSATKMLQSAVIGLIIVLCSYAISSFVVTKLTDKTLIK